MIFHIRKMQPTEYPLLSDFLYEAIFVEKHQPPRTGNRHCAAKCSFQRNKRCKNHSALTFCPKKNPAVTLYQRVGFELYQDKGAEWIMLKTIG